MKNTYKLLGAALVAVLTLGNSFAMEAPQEPQPEQGAAQDDRVLAIQMQAKEYREDFMREHGRYPTPEDFADIEFEDEAFGEELRRPVGPEADAELARILQEKGDEDLARKLQGNVRPRKEGRSKKHGKKKPARKKGCKKSGKPCSRKHGKCRRRK